MFDLLEHGRANVGAEERCPFLTDQDLSLEVSILLTCCGVFMLKVGNEASNGVFE